MPNKFVNKPWRPSKPASKGAIAYHNAVINASWHKKNIGELIKIIGKHIEDGHVVIDFGAGTGGSAIYLLKHIPVNFKLLLVDNSASWLTKAHEELSTFPNVTFSLLEKTGNKYAMLHETIGQEIADHILSANTVHLLPKFEEICLSIFKTLKTGGTFVFQSGNIVRHNRKKGILMIDDTINSLHDIALNIVKTNSRFKKYRKNLDKKIEQEKHQRKLVFPDPRSVEYYLRILKTIGFTNIKVAHKHIKVNYKDWLDFLRVKRLQAGILPEIGGKKPTAREEQERDELITMASGELFNKLPKHNPFANSTSFTAEWIYVKVKKNSVK